ncbi:DUF1203 domain-containing protein [Pseudoalteromonas luteoviolacea]|nr:DUF1203 domain-containing protein [Pseudoalteromonas luteoviolacea]MBQ4879945.1 DUF1203 domain-containing protein [Pseudoalteromonas luteoviolacea]MBQ4908962.1 DUF1203 domain-containing protein [Pseudoalteromonas luteoviolacea]
MKAYFKSERILGVVLTSSADAKSDLKGFSSSEEVSLVIVWYAANGCYLFRGERSG